MGIRDRESHFQRVRTWGVDSCFALDELIVDIIVIGSCWRRLPVGAASEKYL